MVGDGVPESVARFIFQHIDSIEQLDVLLLLHKHPSRTWTALQVSDELRSNVHSADTRLNALRAAGLIEPEASSTGAYGYKPKTRQMAQWVDSLAECYAIRRHRVYELIFSPLKRVRPFANAFTVRDPRKDDEDDG